MKNFLGLIAVAGIAAAANAQTGSLTWTVSTDNGATWTNNASLNSAGSVLVRASFAWSGINGALGFGGSQFDAIVAGAVAGDSVADINRPSPFNFAVQSLAASTYAGGIKIDTAADVAAPGAGTGWIAPGQASLDANGTNFVSANPVAVFTYTLNVANDSAVRTIGSIFNSTTGRALSVYITSAGGQTRLSASAVTTSTATVTVVPTPGTLALAGLGGLAAARRRR